MRICKNDRLICDTTFVVNFLNLPFSRFQFFLNIFSCSFISANKSTWKRFDCHPFALYTIQLILIKFQHVWECYFTYFKSIFYRFTHRSQWQWFLNACTHTNMHDAIKSTINSNQCILHVYTAQRLAYKAKGKRKM